MRIILRTLALFTVLALAAVTRAEVLSVRLSIGVNCPYGLAG